MEVLVFIFYLLLCCLALHTLSYFKHSGLKNWLTGIFLIKVLAGWAYASYFKLPKNFADADTWRFYQLSLTEKKLLLADPFFFLKDLFRHGYHGTGNLFSGDNSYWNDLKSNVIVKILAIMNVFTDSSYHANIILFNFLFLIGLVGLFKIFHHIDPPKKNSLVLSVFLLPSPLFWCSGIHKDGLILTALGTIMYVCYFAAVNKRLSFLKIVIVSLSITLIFFLRNYIALALLPALLCWWISHLLPKKTTAIFIGVYALGLVLFFVAGKISPMFNLPAYVVSKQQEFLALSGRSMVVTAPLQPTPVSFIRFLPSAIDMAFLRPHLFEKNTLSYLPAAIEVLALWLSFGYLLMFGRNKRKKDPFLWLCLAFCLSILLLAGYTIPFYGAIVRYRSIALPILVSAVICLFSPPTLRKNYIK